MRSASRPVVPAGGATELDATGDDCVARYAEQMDALLLHRAAATAWDLVYAANGYVDRRAPWSQAKAGDQPGLDETLGALARCLIRLSVMTVPFIPTAAATLWTALGKGAAMPKSGLWDHATTPSADGLKTSKIPPLFPNPEVASTATP